ncbi:hypothetical protein SRHO_G00143860 [Serrasalmus rhombeus]
MRSNYIDLQKAFVLLPSATSDRPMYDPKTTQRPTPPAIQGCVLTSALDQRRGRVSNALAQNAVLLIPNHIHHGRANLRLILHYSAVQASRTVSVLGGHIRRTRGLNWVEQCDSTVE